MKRTAKGEMVDFDLIKAKSQISKKEPPKEVSVRQQIIDRRLRKKTAKMTPSPLNNTPKPPSKKEVVEEVVEENIIESIEETVDEDVKSEEVPKTKRRRRQKTKLTKDDGDIDADTTD